MLAHLTAVSLAAVVTAGVLGGAGQLLIAGRGLAPLLPLAPNPTPEAPLGTPAPATPSPVATPTATVAPATASPSPSPTRPPLAVAAFSFGGHGYVGITSAATLPVFAAPFAGTIEVRTYQYIDGEVRVGSNVPNLPFFPYVAVVSTDRRMVYRPGALGSVTEVIVRDGASVAAGDPLFRLIAAGRSSWATFYDARAEYQVVVSLQTVPGAKDLDPTAYFRS